eukprot:gene18135-9832_t
MITLSVSSVLAAGLITGGMSISAGETAIDNTQRQADGSVEKCFASGEANIDMVTLQLLQKVVDVLQAKFECFVATPHSISQSFITFM